VEVDPRHGSRQSTAASNDVLVMFSWLWPVALMDFLALTHDFRVLDVTGLGFGWAK